MPTPIELEIEHRGCQRMTRIFDQLSNMDSDIAKHPDFKDFVISIFISEDKQIGFPKEEPIPEPKFERADVKPDMPSTKKAPEDILPKPQDNKLTNKPLEPFDKDHEAWIFCPTCGSMKIHFKSDKTGKEYCACHGCQIFLNVSKEGEPIIKEMNKK